MSGLNISLPGATQGTPASRPARGPQARGARPADQSEACNGPARRTSGQPRGGPAGNAGPHREKRPCARPPTHPACHQNGGNGLERRPPVDTAGRRPAGGAPLFALGDRGPGAPHPPGCTEREPFRRSAPCRALRSRAARADQRSAFQAGGAITAVDRPAGLHFHSNWPPVGTAGRRPAGDAPLVVLGDRGPEASPPPGCTEREPSRRSAACRALRGRAARADQRSAFQAGGANRTLGRPAGLPFFSNWPPGRYAGRRPAERVSPISRKRATARPAGPRVSPGGGRRSKPFPSFS